MAASWGKVTWWGFKKSNVCTAFFFFPVMKHLILSVIKSKTFLSVFRLASKMRAQSPSNAHQYHHSPIRHRPTLLTDDRKAEDKKAEKQQCKTETAVKKTTDINNMNPPSQAEGNVVEIIKTRSSKGETLDKPLKGDTSERNQSPDRKDHKADLSEKTECNAQDGEKKKG